MIRVAWGIVIETPFRLSWIQQSKNKVKVRQVNEYRAKTLVFHGLSKQ